jgi:sugar lactone lactonase YvrE
MADTTTLISGLHFGEGPRWHNGRLQVSDFYQHAVLSIGTDGSCHAVAEVAGQPSGAGWLPDGRALVVSMTDRRVLRQETDGTWVTHAELGHLATFHCNDMVVDGAGRAYVGNFGFDLHGFINERGEAALFEDPSSLATVLCLVQPDGTVELAAGDLLFPNGTVITPDGSTLIIAETLGLRLTAFDIGAQGLLSNRRVWADLSGELIAPDGICLVASGAIWAANAVANQAVRVGEGGEILDRVTTERNCYAVCLGGDDGHTLFCCTAETSDAERAAASTTAAIEMATVAVAAASPPSP